MVSSLSSSDTQIELDNEEQQPEEMSLFKDTSQAKVVHVKFQLQRECAFGQQFLVVGDDAALGTWNPENAVQLNWSEGHVWSVELDIPAGKSIKFKFIMKEGTEKILWQPGPDRIFDAWETNNTITILEDWENSELQMIAEEEPTSNSAPFAENASGIGESNIITGKSDAMSEVPNVITTGKITEAEEKSQVSERRTVKEDSPASLNENGRVITSKEFPTTKYEMMSVVDEDIPVLVPGLMVSTLDTTDEVYLNEAKKKPPTVVSVSNDEEAKGLSLPEIDSKEEKKNCLLHQNGAEETMIREQRFPFSTEQEVSSRMGKEQDQDKANSTDIVLNNDIQWGRRTFQKLLNSLGIL